MNKSEFQQYIYKNIPLTQSMGVSIVEMSEHELLLAAPLSLNFNHKSTGFGGSIMALEALAGWGYTRYLLELKSIECEIVIHKSQVTFDSPVTGDFQARCKSPGEEALQKFMKSIEKRGKGRLQLNVETLVDKKVCSTFVGEYVAILSK